MAIVKFEQDPTQPFGTGNFTNEQGRTLYTTDVKTARELSPSLSSLVNKESTEAASAFVKPPVKDTSGYLASNGPLEGVSSVAGAPVPNQSIAPKEENVSVQLSSPAQALTEKLNAFKEKTAPAANSVSTVPATSATPAETKPELPPVVSSDSTRNVTKGRNSKAVEDTIGKLDKFHQEREDAILSQADKADANNERSARLKEQYLNSQFYEQGTEAANQARIKTAAEAEVKRLLEEKDQAVNPDRFIDNMSTGNKVVMVILAALSGAFRGLSGADTSDNTILKILNNAQEEDLKIQREQIQSGRLRRGNMLQDAMSRGADAKQAEALARAKQSKAMADYTETEINRLNLQGAERAKAMDLVAQLRQQHAVQVDGLRASTEDKISESYSQHREVPKVVAGQTDTEYLKKVYETGAAMEKAGATPEQIQQFYKSQGVPVPQGESSESISRNKETENQTKAVSAMTGLEAFGTESGLKFDPKTGEFTSPGGIRGLQAPELQEVVPGAFGQASPIKDAKEAALESFGRLQSDGVISKEEESRFREMISGDEITRNQLASKLNAIMRIVRPGLSQRRQKENKNTAATDGFTPVN